MDHAQIDDVSTTPYLVMTILAYRIGMAIETGHAFEPRQFPDDEY